MIEFDLGMAACINVLHLEKRSAATGDQRKFSIADFVFLRVSQHLESILQKSNFFQSLAKRVRYHKKKQGIRMVVSYSVLVIMIFGI